MDQNFKWPQRNTDGGQPIRREWFSFTITPDHIGKFVRVMNASSNTITFDDRVFPDGTQIVGDQYGAGQITFTALSGSRVLVRARGGNTIKTNAQYAPWCAIYDALLNEWVISGDLTVT